MTPRDTARALFTDQDDREQIATGYPHPRPGRLTEYERRDRNRRRLGDWLLPLVLAAAMLTALTLYALPKVLKLIERGL